MQKYFYKEEETPAINLGEYCERIFDKQSKKYGKNNAEKTRKRVQDIFTYALKQLNNSMLNNNILLVGKVQSGKTSNLEFFTSMAFDNGYKCVVIYGGYDTKLLKQTSNRFKKTFDIDNEDVDFTTPELFSTDNVTAVEGIDDDVVDCLIDSNKPIIIVSMKRPKALSKVNKMVEILSKKGIKTFIIDDEGDQASLNTENKEPSKMSPTYEQIITMKDTLNDPLYLSVTATPQANVLLGQYSKLKPDGIRLIEPGNGYTGAEFFLTDDYKIFTINNDELDDLNNGELTKSLLNAIKYFIISSAIMKEMGIEKSDMIIHTARTTNMHKKIYDRVLTYFKNLQDNIKENDEDLDVRLQKIGEVYNDEYFKKEIIQQYRFGELIDKIKVVISKMHIILQDSQGDLTQANEKYYQHKIYIGGDLLQRGLTFEHLVTTFFTRWPKNGGNMDTTIQRARWLGYRMKFLDLCKVFTTDKIKLEYCALEESESDLWEQCESIEKGEKKIDDMVIDANSSTLNPTRRNVANYKKIQFNKNWSNQKYGVFDKTEREKNNANISKYLDSLTFSQTNIGRTDKGRSCDYTVVNDKKDFYSMLEENNNIFNRKPFNINVIKKISKDKDIILEKFFLDKDDVRERSFYEDGRIYALQQGADTADESKKKYLGDSSVIVNKNAIVIQIFLIQKKNTNIKQYMFSIHVPDNRKGFVKK